MNGNARRQGRVALVTGSNTGIGRAAARELARAGWHVVLACRSVQRTRQALDEIRAAGGSAEPLALDLADFASVRAGAAAWLAGGRPLHVLVNNAGVAGARGATRAGFEFAFGVNHLGHFLLTQLLLERLRASAPARVVTVASKAHFRVRGIDWEALRQPTRTAAGLAEYGVSKLCNVLFSAELGRRLAGSGVTTYALHPGVVATDIWRQVPRALRGAIKLLTISAERGARTTLYCATADEIAAQTGLYYDRCKVKAPSALAQDPRLAQELWRRSEEWVA